MRGWMCMPLNRPALGLGVRGMWAWAPRPSVPFNPTQASYYTRARFQFINPPRHNQNTIREGAKICLLQCSYEAPAIFTLLQLVLASEAQDPSFGAWKTESEGAYPVWFDWRSRGNSHKVLSHHGHAMPGVDPINPSSIPYPRCPYQNQSTRSERRGLDGLPDLGRRLLR